MNPDAPRTPREELEIRITALLMGQLPQDEAAELLRQIAADPELTALYNQMRHAVELLREARSLPEQAAPEIPLQLSKERRAVLLAKFRGLKPMPPLKSVPTPGFSPSPRTILAPPKKKRDWKWVVPVGIAASFLIVVGGAVFFPMASRTRSQVVTREADDFVGEESILSLTVEPRFSLFSREKERDESPRTDAADKFARPAATSSPVGASGKDALAGRWAESDAKTAPLYAGRKLAEAAPAPRRGSVLYLPKAAPETAPTSGAFLADVSGGTTSELLTADNPAPSPMESKPMDNRELQNAAGALAASVQPLQHEDRYRQKGKAAAVVSGEGTPLPAVTLSNAVREPVVSEQLRANAEGDKSAPMVALADQPARAAIVDTRAAIDGTKRFGTQQRVDVEKSEVAASGPGEVRKFLAAPLAVEEPMSKSKKLEDLAKSVVDKAVGEKLVDGLADNQRVEKEAIDSLQTAVARPALPAPAPAVNMPAKPVAAAPGLPGPAEPQQSAPGTTPASPAVTGLGLSPLGGESFQNGIADAGDVIAGKSIEGVQATAERELQRRKQRQSGADGEMERGRKALAAGISKADESRRGEAEDFIASDADGDKAAGAYYFQGAHKAQAATERGEELREAKKETDLRAWSVKPGRIADVDRLNKSVEKAQEQTAKGQSEFAGLAYDSAREQALTEVSKEWSRPYRRFDSKADEKVLQQNESVALSEPALTADRVNLGTEFKSGVSAGQADEFWAYTKAGTTPTAGKKAAVQLDGRSGNGVAKVGNGTIELGDIAAGGGKPTVPSADDAVFWDIPGGGEAKAGQQWFGRSAGGFAGGAGGATTQLFTSGGSRGNSLELNRADSLGRTDGTTVLARDASEKAKGTKAPGAAAEGQGLELAPPVVEFEGFINYGTPIAETSIDANGREVKGVVTSSALGNLRATKGTARNDEDNVAELRGMKFTIPAPSAPVTVNGGQLDQSQAIKLPSLAQTNGVQATQSVDAKPAAVLEKLEKKLAESEPPAPPQKAEPPVPQPEISTKENAFSTFSLNVSDVSFKLAAASLEKGAMPEVASVRTEEFINALDYRDPEPAAGAPLAFASERARYPFAHNRDLLRLSVKTAAEGRQADRPLNLTLLLDNSGSMERADRVRILEEALRVLGKQLQPQDKLSIITFSRTPRLWCDGVEGNRAGEFTGRVAEIRPEGGTDLGAAMDLGYKTALKHYQVGSVNRVVLLTDGAANLGNVNPDTLRKTVEKHRKQGVAFDCFGVGWEGYNDTLLEQLSRNGDGRYGFINSPEAAATEFAGALAGALRVAASDVKVQVEFNPRRVTSYRQLGYAKHQLKKEQFRDNTVDAAEIGAAESGNALYTVEVNPNGVGEIATVRVRFKVPGTSDYREHEWTVPFTSPAPALEQGSSSLKLAATAGAFAEMLAQSPFAAEVSTDRLLGMINGIPAIYGADPRPGKLEWMVRQAKSISGR